MWNPASAVWSEPSGLEAFALMLERYPEWVGKVCFIEVGVPSRVELAEYQALQNRTRALVDDINRRFHRKGGTTVELIEANLDFRDLVP